MGWDSCDAWDTKEKTVAAVLRDLGGNLIDYTVKGGELWSVVRTSQGILVIAVHLLRKDRGERGYSVKSMTTDMHPYYYKCPKGYLAMVPEYGDKAWREAYTNRAEASVKLKAELQPGVVVKLVAGVTFQGAPLAEAIVITTKPLVVKANGTLVKLSRKLIASVGARKPDFMRDHFIHVTVGG